MPGPGRKLVARNRKAFHEYHIEDRIEAGLALEGTEVKSVRAGKISLGEGWVDIDKDFQPFLCEVHISAYDFGNIHNHDPKRRRRLLLHKHVTG